MPCDHNQTFKTLLIQTEDKPIKYGDSIDLGEAFGYIIRQGLEATSVTGGE
jgi:hypothetical protein